MADYMIRVELHGPAADYEALRLAMAKGGALPVLPGTDGQDWRLPTGTFVLKGKPGGCQQLRDVVRSAAKAGCSDPEAWVLVTEFTDAAWFGKEVGAPAA